MAILNELLLSFEQFRKYGETIIRFDAIEASGTEQSRASNNLKREKRIRYSILHSVKAS